MEDSDPTFEDLLRRALVVARNVEATYLAHAPESVKYPRSLDEFKRVAQALYPKLVIDIQTPNVEALVEIKAALMFRGPWEAIVVLPKSAKQELPRDQQHFAIYRGYFQTILRNELAEAVHSVREEVDQAITRSWENALSEELRELTPSNLLETLADTATAEFLFPYRERLKVYANSPDVLTQRQTSVRFGIPIGIARYYLHPALISAFQEIPLLSVPTQSP